MDSECNKGPLSEKCPDENEICRPATGKYHGVQNWSAENLPCVNWDDPGIGHVYYGTNCCSLSVDIYLDIQKIIIIVECLWMTMTTMAHGAM